MRSFTAVVWLTGASALAQNGTWTGYVGGWKDDARSTVSPRWQRRGVAPPAMWLTTPVFLAAPQATERTDAERARAAQAQASLQLELEATRQQLALEQRQAAAQAQLAAQQRQLAAEEFAAMERVAAEEQRLTAERRLAQEQAEREREALRQQEERLAQARAAAPRTAGPDIYHWVDADGVQVYSTRPPPGARR